MHYTPNWSLWNMIPTQISVHTHLPISKIFKLSSMAPLSSNRNLRLLSMVMVRARHHCHFWYFLPTQCYITTNLCKLTTYQIPKEIYNAILITIATCSSTWMELYWHTRSVSLTSSQHTNLLNISTSIKPFTLLHFQCFLCFVAIPHPSKKNSQSSGPGATASR
jgi:hypothetical protein